jgi:hypothetical protein
MHFSYKLHFVVSFSFTICKLLPSWFLQILIYTETIAQMLDTSLTNVRIVDDCGNVWDFDLIFGTLPYEHCRIGGHWKRFVEARRLREGVKIRLGALNAGMNECIYLDVVYN